MRATLESGRARAYSGADGEDIRIMELERRTAVALEIGDLELGMLIEKRKKADERRAMEEEEERREMEREVEAWIQVRKRVRGVKRWRKDVPTGEDAEIADNDREDDDWEILYD